jgi:DnaK suppressor protein
LIAEGDLKADPNRDDPATILDEDEQPLNEMNQVITSQRNRRRAEELAGIEGALRRMEQDPEEFGVCLDCDEYIPIGRLELMPWATRCVQCQSAHGDGPRDRRRRHALDFIDS